MAPGDGAPECAEAAYHAQADLRMDHTLGADPPGGTRPWPSSPLPNHRSFPFLPTFSSMAMCRRPAAEELLSTPLFAPLSSVLGGMLGLPHRLRPLGGGRPLSSSSYVPGFNEGGLQHGGVSLPGATPSWTVFTAGFTPIPVQGFHHHRRRLSIFPSPPW